ncbi:MAG: mechanosensitive ion channel family protein, partial [Pseudomonadota bacterium]|nr:mechanosensitive ion channel family protein [Pseudomonadota bacterium]
DVGREFLRRIKLAFDANDIEIPFPQRTMHFTSDQQALPLQLLAGDAALRDADDEGETRDRSAAGEEARAAAMPGTRQPAAASANRDQKTAPGEIPKEVPKETPKEAPKIVPPPEPPPQVQTDTEFSEEEAREVERKNAFKTSPPPDGNPS